MPVASTETEDQRQRHGHDHDGRPSGAALLLILLGLLTSLAFFIWNTCPAGPHRLLHRQGRAGHEADQRADRPADRRRHVVRALPAHILDALPCYLGYLWPRDRKRQTFADKIVKTVVINQPKG